MSQHTQAELSELPTDFTQFLSTRLGMETSTALSLLGSFLLTFEPATGHHRPDWAGLKGKPEYELGLTGR